MQTIIRLLLPLTGILLLVLSTQALSEKDNPICFRHKETHAIVRPCQTFKSDNDAYTRIFCMDESETMQPFKPANMDAWEQLEGDICTPQKVRRGCAQRDEIRRNIKRWLSKTQLSFIKQNKDIKLWAPYVMGGKIQ